MKDVLPCYVVSIEVVYPFESEGECADGMTGTLTEKMRLYDPAGESPLIDWRYSRAITALADGGFNATVELLIAKTTPQAAEDVAKDLFLAWHQVDPGLDFGIRPETAPVGIAADYEPDHDPFPQRIEPHRPAMA